ncbi:Ig-like domain-containing protein [Flavisolibacter nicotianae]|uniref:Ig-like domain-containing protein n=1 Tax=Flavisolibacter nicotianae TaxID=2364882 RepID=UPI001968EDEF|nr:Ig-like domain-containing protein [Flavisolibacter nicotianae]
MSATSVGGTVSQDQTICNNTAPASLTLSGNTGNVIRWEKSTFSDFSSGVTTIASTSVTLSSATIGNLATTTYFRAVVQSGVCGSTPSQPVTITVRPTPTATISGTTAVCEGTTEPSVTFNNPRALPVTVTYKINNGGNLTIDVPAGGSASVNQPTTTPGDYTYTLISVAYQDGTPACSAAITGSATISVNAELEDPIFNAGLPDLRCQFGATVNYQATAKYSTKIEYFLDNASIAAGVTIDKNTGSVTYPASFYGTTTITAVATGFAPGCNTMTRSSTKTITTTQDGTITLTTGTASQTVCVNIAIADIGYTIGGTATGATVTGLPAGLTSTFNAGVFTITGTPTVSGIFNYTVTTTGSDCANPSLGGTITVTGNGTIALTSAASTTDQTKCINTPITNITYSIGGTATGATAAGLPTGVTGNYSGGVFTISGTPTVSGSFPYTVTTTGSLCVNPQLTGTITVTADGSITLTSAASTTSQTVCINTALTNITYNIGGTATGATATGLPNGVTGNYSAGVFTISGTPTQSGTFPYTVKATGSPCVNPQLAGTIIVTPDNTITLSSAAGTDAQTKCINTAITGITYTTTGATGATFAGLPAGVNGTWAANSITIAGTPTVSGNFTYTITLTGGCGTITKTGTINVTPANTVTAASATPTLCINTPLTPITHTTTGATGIGAATGLPAGVTASFASNTITISGTPTASGTFNYTIPLTGGCGTVSATGTITVTADGTLTRTSAAATTSQTVCINTAITNITYSIGGTATGATLGGTLPTGVTGSFNAGVFTISGTPTVSGTFSYTVTATGSPCVNPSLSGTITVTADGSITLTSAAATTNQTLCINTPITDITYSIGGSATGASVTGLPSGVTGTYNAGVFTISGTPTVSGPFNYTVTVTGSPCVNPSLTGKIVVTPNNTISLSSAPGTDAQTKCINTPITNITYATNGAPGATVTGLPAGVTGNWAANVFTISGTPTVSGNFTYTITLTGGCGVITKTGTINVTPNNTVTAASSTPTLCINTALTPITHTTTGATGIGAATGLPAGVTASWASNTITISGTPTASGTFNYTIPLTGGCSSVNATGTINVTPASVGGSITPAITTVCANAPGGTLTLSGFTGTVVRWESSTNGGTAWTQISNTTTSQPYTTTQTTIYRAFVQNGICGGTYSTNAVISVIPPTIPTATSSPAVICQGQTATLSATSGLPLLGTGIDGSFNQANPAGWQVTENGTQINFPAQANNSVTNPWSESNGPKDLNGVTYNNLQTDGKFAVASGVVSTYLETPVFSTLAMSSAILQFYQAYNFNAGTVGKIEISTDGGATYSNTLVQYNGAQNPNLGNPTNSWVSTSLDLSSYLGLTNLRIRFNFQGVDGPTKSNWAIDGLGFTAPAPTISYAWTPTATLTPSSGLGQTVTASPTTTTTYTVTTTVNGCTGGTQQVTVTVNPQPTVNAVSSQTVCHNAPTAAINFTGTNTTSFTWTNNNTSIGLAASGTGNIGSFTAVNTGTAPVTATITVTPVITANGKTCNGNTTTFTFTVNPLPTATISGNAAACQGGTAPAVTFTGAGGTAPYTFTYTINGVAQAPLTSTGNTATVTQPTSTVGTYTYALVSVKDASSTTCSRNITGQSAVITINALPTISGALNLCIGSTTALTGSGTPAATNPWTSSAPSVATVSTTGVVTGLAAGSAVITYTNNNGCSISTTVVVNPLPMASISGNTAVCQGDPAPSVTFRGTNGTAPYTFTYTVNDGTTTVTKTVTSPSSSSTAAVTQPTTTIGTYTYTLVSVQDASASTCSNTVSVPSITIDVNAPTAVGSTSGGGTYCSNAMTAISVTATGKGLTYQWYNNGSNNSNTGGTAISGATATSYTPPATVGTTYYYVVVTGACGSQPSNPIPVTVVRPPVLAPLAPIPPVCNGSTLKLSVFATNPSDVTGYQWYKDGQPISGATSSSYTIPFVTASDAGNYYVVVSAQTPCASVTSGTMPVSTYESNVTIWNSGLGTNEWHQDLNWTCKMPNLYRDAIVPIVSNKPYPYIAAGLVGQTRKLTIDAGGPTVTLDGILQMAGDVTNNGVIDAYRNGINSTGSLEFMSNDSVGNLYPNNITYAQKLFSTTNPTPVTRTQHLKISNQVTFSIPVDVYGKLSFGGSNKTLNTGDQLTLKSVSSTVSAMVMDRTNGTGVEQNNLVNNKVIVERFIDGALGRRWRLVTAPVSGVNINQAWQEGTTWNGTGTIPSTGYSTLITGNAQGSAATANANGFDFWASIANAVSSIRRYQGNPDWHLALWVPFASTISAGFNSYEAYLLFVRGDRSVTAGVGQTTLHPKGPLKEALAHTITVQANQSHTLVGNPYASPLNFKRIYDDNAATIEPFFWVWQAALGTSGGYILVKPTAPNSAVYESVPDGGTTVSPADPIISTGEGFFVVPKDAVPLPAPISIKQTHKDSLASKVAVFRLPAGDPAKIRLRVYTNDGGKMLLLDGAQAEFSADGNKGFNIAKAVNISENLSIRSAGRDMIVTTSGKPRAGDTVQLRIWNTTAKEYQLQVSADNFTAPLATGLSGVLVDRYLQKETPFSLQGGRISYTYRINADAASKNTLRFFIVFTRAVSAPPALPALTVTLDAKQKGREGVQLNWQVADEKEVKTYELQRSKDGTQFTAIATKEAKGQGGPQEYRQIDPSPFYPLSYYRVRVVLANGQEVYTNVARVSMQEEELLVYPNPVRAGEALQVEFRYRPQGTYTFRLYSPAGQLVMQQNMKHQGGSAIIWLPLGTQLASGFYTMELARPDGRKEKVSVNVLR